MKIIHLHAARKPNRAATSPDSADRIAGLLIRVVLSHFADHFHDEDFAVGHLRQHLADAIRDSEVRP